MAAAGTGVGLLEGACVRVRDAPLPSSARAWKRKGRFSKLMTEQKKKTSRAVFSLSHFFRRHTQSCAHTRSPPVAPPALAQLDLCSSPFTHTPGKPGLDPPPCRPKPKTTHNDAAAAAAVVGGDRCRPGRPAGGQEGGAQGELMGACVAACASPAWCWSGLASAQAGARACVFLRAEAPLRVSAALPGPTAPARRPAPAPMHTRTHPPLTSL